MSQNSEEINTTSEDKSSILAEVSVNEDDIQEDYEEDKEQDIHIEDPSELLMQLKESIKGKTPVLKPGYLNSLSQKLNQEDLKPSAIDIESDEHEVQQIVLIESEEIRNLNENGFMWWGRIFKTGPALGGHCARATSHKFNKELIELNMPLPNFEKNKDDKLIFKTSPVKRGMIKHNIRPAIKYNLRRKNSKIPSLCDLPSSASTPVKSCSNAYDKFGNISSSSYDF